MPNVVNYMNIISWNVAGLTTFIKKYPDLLKKVVLDQKADVICLQETKLQDKAVAKMSSDLGFGSWSKSFSCSVAKLGHAGVLTMSKKTPISVSTRVGDAELDREGRLLVTEFDDFFLINVYVMNSGIGLISLKKRLTKWDPALHRLATKLQRQKPVMITGDFNVSAEHIDIYDPKHLSQSPGFTDEERCSFKNKYLKNGWIDAWRETHPGQRSYTFYSKKTNMRLKGLGWRLDYFLLSYHFKPILQIIQCEILEIYPDASDHLPIMISIRC